MRPRRADSCRAVSPVTERSQTPHHPTDLRSRPVVCIWRLSPVRQTSCALEIVGGGFTSRMGSLSRVVAENRLLSAAVNRSVSGLGLLAGDGTVDRPSGGGPRSRRPITPANGACISPWIPEPGPVAAVGLGCGPDGGRPTQLWCAWLAWSRFRVGFNLGQDAGHGVAVSGCRAAPGGRIDLCPDRQRRHRDR